MSCRAKMLIPGELQCKPSSSPVLGEKKRENLPQICVVLLQVYSMGQEGRAGMEGSLAGGADAAAAGDHQPERKIGLLWSWMLCASQCEVSNTERDSQSGDSK